MKFYHKAWVVMILMLEDGYGIWKFDGENYWHEFVRSIKYGDSPHYSEE